MLFKLEESKRWFKTLKSETTPIKINTKEGRYFKKVKSLANKFIIKVMNIARRIVIIQMIINS